MVSLLGTSLANTFIARVKICLNHCPNEFKSVYFKRYVENIFVLFQSLHRTEKFN